MTVAFVKYVISPIISLIFLLRLTSSHVDIPLGIIFLLLDLLRRNDVAELARLIEKDAGLPSLELYMQRCESCGESSARLTVRSVTPGRGGSLQFSDLSKAVLPPTESGLFLKQLRFEAE